MERKIIWLIVASTTLMGVLFWFKREPTRPAAPRFSSKIDVLTACQAQKEIWCDMVMPDGATLAEEQVCTREYLSRCTICLFEVERARRSGQRTGYRYAGCPALRTWKDDHRRPDDRP